MKPITQYQAYDGSIWHSAEKARAREIEADLIFDIMEPLGPPNKSDAGWVQHKIETVNAAKKAILLYVRPTFLRFPKVLEAIDNAPETVHPGSIVGRILSEIDGPVDDAWRRLYCIDSQGREHNQPFLAINGPHKEHVCLETRE